MSSPSLARQLADLHDQYRRERRTETLKLEEFEQLLLLFPSVLVLQADGHIDTTEMMFLSQMAKILSRAGASLSEADLRQEVRYLSRSVNYWRKPFMEVLVRYIEERRVATEVLDLMISAASSSTGNVRQNILIRMHNRLDDGTGALEQVFISEEEKYAILNLVAELNMSMAPGVVERLQVIMGPAQE